MQDSRISSPSPASVRLLFGPIVFHGPQSRSRSVTGIRLFALYMVALGVWGVVGCWHRQPVLAAVAGLIYLEQALAGVRGSMLVGDVVYDERLARRIAPPLFELCGRAGCQAPTVVVRDDRLRGAGVLVANGERRLVLSGVLLDRLSDRQLRAVLAHEVAHLVAGDLRRVRVRTFVGFAAGLGGTVLLGVQIGYRPEYSPLFAACFLFVLLVARFPLSIFNRPLELRADADGAKLAMDALGEAEALRIADAFAKETRRELLAGYWGYLLVLSPLRWRLPTHPPISQRTARLDRFQSSSCDLPAFADSPIVHSAPEASGPQSPLTVPAPEIGGAVSSSWQRPSSESEWATVPGEAVNSNRGARVALLMVGLGTFGFIALIAASYRSPRGESSTSESPSAIGFSSEAPCFAPQAGTAISLSVSVAGGEPPYKVEWTLNGRPDTTDPVSMAPTQLNNAAGQQYTIKVVPTSDDETMIATITDANHLDSVQRLRVLGSAADCSQPLPPAGG